MRRHTHRPRATVAAAMVSVALGATQHVVAWLVWQAARVSLLDDLPRPNPPGE